IKQNSYGRGARAHAESRILLLQNAHDSIQYNGSCANVRGQSARVPARHAEQRLPQAILVPPRLAANQKTRCLAPRNLQVICAAPLAPPRVAAASGSAHAEGSYSFQSLLK